MFLLMALLQVLVPPCPALFHVLCHVLVACLLFLVALVLELVVLAVG